MKKFLVILLLSLMLSCHEQKEIPRELWQLEIGLDKECAIDIMDILKWESNITVGDSSSAEIIYHNKKGDTVVLGFEKDELIEIKAL
jgi:hypothetical protein